MHILCTAAVGVTLVLGAESEYVTEKDREVAKLADERMDLYCHGEGFKGHMDDATAASRRQSLIASLGGKNVAHEVLKESTSPEDVGNVFMENYGVGWLISKGAAVLMAFLTLVSCLLFCLGSVCRCCAYERPTRRKLKLYVAIVIGAVLFGLIICTFQSLNAYWTTHDGLHNMQCTGVRLLDTSLRGEKAEDGTYKGLLPILEEFQKAENTLQQGSQFMHGLDAVLRITDDIKKSVAVVSHTVQLLKDMMKHNENLKTAAGQDLLHECRLCKVIGKKLDDAITAFHDSPAYQLAGARSAMETQLSEPEKEKMKEELRNSAKKLVALKNTSINLVSHMLEEGGTVKKMKEQEDLIGGLTLAAVVLGTLSAVILSACAGVSIYSFTFHEFIPEKEEQNENPYNHKIHKYAHSTWCWGFCYMFWTFLIAGLIFVVSAPVSSLCVLLDDLDSNLMRDIAPGMGMDLEGDAAAVPAVVDRCFKPGGDAVDAYFLDILYTTEDGRKVTARDKIDRYSRSVASKFAVITQNSDRPAPPLAGSREMQPVLRLLAFDRLDATLTGVPSKLNSNDAYADAGIPKAGLTQVLKSSIACEDLVLDSDMASSPGETIPGIKSLVTKMKSFGPESPGTGCAKKVTCSGGGFTEHACKAANRYIDLKQEARSSSRFRCDLFESPSDSRDCDPLNMKSEHLFETVTWTGDCLDSDGTMKRKQKTCSLAEFSAYVKKFEQRLRKVLQRLDEQMELEVPSVSSSMYMLLNNHVLKRSKFIANGVTCKFFAKYYQELINGVCYQSVYGLRGIAKSYVWCAILAALLVLSMYAVWCRSKGNIENWKADRSEYQALVQKEKDEEEARKRAAERKANGEEEERWILGSADDERRRVVAPTTAGPPRISSTVEDG